MRKFLQKRGTLSLMGSLVSILAGLLLGFILLLIFNPAHAIGGLEDMLLSGARDMSKLGKVLYTAAPLLMTGLSVGFAFKTGLFNIGASGQYTVGAFFALTVGIQFQLPWYVAILAGMIGGAMLGLSVENGYVGEIAFAPNGLPTSHKKDHGVGLASVAATVKRHNGTLSIAAKDGVFSAHILLSL